MVAEKRKFQTGQPVSTRRRAKKAKMAEARAVQQAVTPSKKQQRKAARPPKPVRVRKEEDVSDDEEEEEEDEEDEDEAEAQDQVEQDDDDEEEEETKESQGQRQQQRAQAIDDEDSDEESEPEPVGKGRKGYKPKVKKPSGKKGKVFADTSAMLSIIDQVAGKEEERAKIKQTNMASFFWKTVFYVGKIKSKHSDKEKKVQERENAKKALLNQKIEEIKKKKTEKRKESKHRAAEQEAKAQASTGKRSVSFQV
ncbi:hypothetical protein BGZ83_008714 [Gryganskiella cystojenkinii]|nr:hypothetical protein BGZ83_008714 [Gryganskiella cystojenkinii]